MCHKPNCGCNKKMIKPTSFRKGGMVKAKHKNIPSSALPKGDVDTAFARLQVGELVIPKRLTKKVSKFLKNEKIKLPGM